MIAWGATETVKTGTLPGGLSVAFNYTRTIAVDDNGRIYIAYAHGGDLYLLVNTLGTWATLSDSSDTCYETPAIAVSGTDILLVAVRDSDEVVAFRPGWWGLGTPEVVSAMEHQEAEAPSASFGPGGVPHIVYVALESSSSPRQIYYVGWVRKRTAGVSWSEPEQLSDNGSGALEPNLPSVAAGGNGRPRVMVAWHQVNTSGRRSVVTRAAGYSSGGATWGSEIVLAGMDVGESDAWDPNVWTAPDGTFYVGYQQTPDAVNLAKQAVVVRSSADGTTWDPAPGSTSTPPVLGTQISNDSLADRPQFVHGSSAAHTYMFAFWEGRNDIPVAIPHGATEVNEVGLYGAVHSSVGVPGWKALPDELSGHLDGVVLIAGRLPEVSFAS